MDAEKFAQICPASKKAEKIYEAVKLLIEEGKDINAVTVAEITEKAGIGKGTAYEYFKSKEEMVAKSIVHGMMKNLQEVEEKVGEKTTFREKYLGVLEWMESIYESKGSIMMFFQISQESLRLSAALKQELGHYISGPEYILESIEKMIQWGVEHEHLDSQLPPKMQSSMLFASFISFWVYINHTPKESREELDKKKDILYRGLVQSLLIK
ncbi:MAG: TetR/AcrR family transcriptional regulator [Clostridia bacterium]|nr:TetR/AcrR family transcriptional regulator [Clostridia bacterium]NCC43710.1 TetR/AcrR family transcriptional regulator [Clostridia bacterium]